MNNYRLITDADLANQRLLNNEIEEMSVEKPLLSLEPLLLAQLAPPATFLMGYDDVTVGLPNPSNGDAFPHPSMMHFVLAKFLKEEIKQVESLADFGCGAGFLGAYAGAKLSPTKLFFSDLSPSSIIASANNYSRNNITSEPKVEQLPDRLKLSHNEREVELVAGDVLYSVMGRQFGIAVACPIYIPGIVQVFPQAYAVFGQAAKSSSAKFIFSHSSLTDEHIIESAKHIGAKLELGVASLEMPLIVDTADPLRAGRDPLGDGPNVSYLKTLGLKDSDSPRSHYAHEIKVSIMSF
ncbi:MAG: methyltransferase [Nanoarchaeota archaeon]|nr:methyltransferase [Nanoarchaeota archaeon]